MPHENFSVSGKRADALAKLQPEGGHVEYVGYENRAKPGKFLGVMNMFHRFVRGVMHIQKTSVVK